MTISQALAAAAALTLLPPLNAAKPGNKASPKRVREESGASRPHVVERAAPVPITAIRGELTLERAVAVALQQNPDILRAKKEIERTRGQVIEVRAQALPHLTATGSYTQEDPNLIETSGGGGGFQLQQANGQTVDINTSSQSRAGTQDKSWRIAIEVNQLLYSGGQVAAALKIAKFTEDQSIYLMRDTVDKVVAQTRTQFYAILLDRKLINVEEENIKLLQDELKDQKNRFDAGTVPKFNVLRAEVAVANAQPNLIRARNNYLIAQLQLAKTLGLEAPRNGNVKPTFEAVGELRMTDRPLSPAQALSLARERRSFLKAQKQNILNEEQQIVVAKAGYKPSLSAHAGYEVQNSRLSDNLSDEVNGWYFGVNGTWNVFDGFETKGKVLQAQARLASAKILYQDSILQVELEVQQALSSLNEARELIASQGKVVEQATEALRLARERLAAGAGTQLDVLDAQVALTQARTTQQQALHDFNVAQAEVDRAIGAETFHDNTYKDVVVEKSKKHLRAGDAGLREED